MPPFVLAALAIAAAQPPTSNVVHVHAAIRGGMVVSVRDYPADALKKEEEGRTELRFEVDTNGAVQDCEITLSSGSTALDERSCEIAQRGRFRPARDAQGNTVPERWRWAITWHKVRSIVMDDMLPEGVVAQPPAVVGKGDWSGMAALRLKSEPKQDARRLNDAVSAIFSSRKCEFGTASAERYDIELRYAVQLSPQGDVRSLLIEDVGCRPLELIVAATVLDREFRRAIEPPADPSAKWHMARMRFKGRD